MEACLRGVHTLHTHTLKHVDQDDTKTRFRLRQTRWSQTRSTSSSQKTRSTRYYTILVSQASGGGKLLWPISDDDLYRRGVT